MYQTNTLHYWQGARPGVGKPASSRVFAYSTVSAMSPTLRRVHTGGRCNCFPARIGWRHEEQQGFEAVSGRDVRAESEDADNACLRALRMLRVGVPLSIATSVCLPPDLSQCSRGSGFSSTYRKLCYTGRRICCCCCRNSSHAARHL